MDHDLLAQQVKLAYEFMDTLHQQALSLIKDVEGQLSSEGIRCMRPGGYKFNYNSVSASLDQPKPALTDFYCVFFKCDDTDTTTTSTPVDGTAPRIGFVRVTLRERHIYHPEVRFGVIEKVEKPDPSKQWPKKVEDALSTFSSYAFGTKWKTEGSYQDSYVSMNYKGMTVRLADLPSSEAIEEKIVTPLLQLLNWDMKVGVSGN
jgi:hypothetical protein